MTDPATEQPEQAPRVWLSRLTIHSFRNVAPTTLSFSRSYNILLGINASGKTTLLKLISACIRGDFMAYKDEVFEVEYVLEIHGYNLRIRVKNVEKNPSHSELLSKNLEASYNFELSFEGIHILSNVPNSIKISESTWSNTELIVSEDPLSSGFFWFFFGEIFDLARLHHPRGNQACEEVWESYPFVRLCHRFNESLSFMNSMTGWPSENHENIPNFHLEARENRKGQSRVSSELSSRTLDRILWDLVPPATQHDSLVFFDKNLGFLAQFSDSSSFKKSELILLSTSEEAKRPGLSKHFGPMKFRFYLENGGYISESLLSYGQKRLLSFLYYVDCNPSIVIADELVNGLHHRWITTCIEAIGDRQAFLTSQNPLLLDYLGPGSVGETQERFVQCKLEKRDGEQWIVWQNLGPEAAEQFYQDYEAGVMQVSELLRAHGLW